ncbi:hypothetical protein VTI74DRAFT_7239 [Chaetomium olivicolor]
MITMVMIGYLVCKLSAQLLKIWPAFVAGCITVRHVNCATCLDGYQAQHCVTGSAQDYTGCWPPATPQAGSPIYPYLGWGFYSPGVACPTGYTAACTAEYGARPDWSIQFVLFPGETAIGCCPEGFRCGNNDGNTCYAIVPTNDATVVPTGVCSGTNIVGVTQATLPVAMTIAATTTNNGAVSIATSTERPEFTLWAPMFQINHRSSDLESASRASTSSSGLPTTSPSASAQGGLSTGAIVGISVGAAIGAILLAAIVGCLWWTRVRKPRQAAAMVPSLSSPGTNNRVEADCGHSNSELPTKDALYYVRPELEDLRYPAELPSSPWGHMPNQG